MLLSQNEIAIGDDQKTRSLGDLQLFKMLLQPHFLFNSLNNLYALSVSQSDRTADAIAGLSELLEKVVSCARQDMISLSDEVELIREYMKLEEIWLGTTNMIVDFQVSGNTDNVQVPPLVLYTFVENCFKHGIRKCGGEGWLKIKLTVRNGKVSFSTRNMVPTWDTPVEDKGRNGFGIVAARELLEKKFKNRYNLVTGLAKNTYCVNLEIDTNNTKYRQ
jgi:LytS/YehU family sensor histidine kinase